MSIERALATSSLGFCVTHAKTNGRKTKGGSDAARARVDVAARVAKTRRAIALTFAFVIARTTVKGEENMSQAMTSGEDAFERNDLARAREMASKARARAGDDVAEEGGGGGALRDEGQGKGMKVDELETNGKRNESSNDNALAPKVVRESSNAMDTKQLLNNSRIKTYNNAPADFPAFIREGYDVRVVHGNDYVVQANGLIVKDYVEGDGEKPRENQECTFEYVAYNENGGTIDSTYRRGAPAMTRIGINGMIPGFELGLKDMRRGGRRRIIVPPELGPPTGPATFFSAKQWEVFDIELLDVKSCSRSSFGMVSSVTCE